MLPRIVLHNSISLDGSLTNFEPHMGLHYQIAGKYKPEIHLIGSNTVLKGVELYGDGIPPEEKIDFEKPNRDKNLPYWVVVDTRGILKGMLHTGRRFEFCRDVVVLVSETTPKSYLEHLKERHYDHFVIGPDHVDLEKALELFAIQFQAQTILADTGRILGNVLLNAGLVDEISLLIHPIIVGNNAYGMFSEIEENVRIKLLKKEILNDGFVWLVYTVENK